MGQPFQLLVLLQFPHPAEKQGRSQMRSADLGRWVMEVAEHNPAGERMGTCVGSAAGIS